MCHLIWLLSRKYGTVWYHPASSKLWYLTALPFVNFQEKLTGTSFALCACEASFVRLAVCLALSALFASTGINNPSHSASRWLMAQWKDGSQMNQHLLFRCIGSSGAPPTSCSRWGSLTELLRRYAPTHRGSSGAEGLFTKPLMYAFSRASDEPLLHRRFIWYWSSSLGTSLSWLKWSVE
jgi:hypothetical protein